MHLCVSPFNPSQVGGCVQLVEKYKSDFIMKLNCSADIGGSSNYSSEN